MLNLPKTGSTFARTILKKLYEKKNENLFNKILHKLGLRDIDMIELKLPNVKMGNISHDQHGIYSQIPKKYLNRTVISVIRNPYSRFLSLYEYKSWANPNQLTVDKSVIEEKFPKFPNLDMDDYVDLIILAENNRLKFITGDISNKHDIGEQTIQFVQMFFKNPKEAIVRLNENYIASGAYKKDMGPIKFLRQDRLNEDLYAFLLTCDFKDDEISFIKNYKKMNVTKSKGKERKELWTQKALDYVTYRERFLLLILKDFGMEYQSPALR